MVRASELTRVSADLAIWQTYDPAVKAELFSTAVATGDGAVAIVDPIALAAPARAEIDEMGNVSAVLVTNANHARAAKNFASVERIFVPSQLKVELPGASDLSGGMRVSGLRVMPVDGAAPGEVAIHDPRDGGTLIVGDALINFEPYGFNLLPTKYCTSRQKMLCSLRHLVDELSFERIFFAHGYPILTRAHERLASLLNEV